MRANRPGRRTKALGLSRVSACLTLFALLGACAEDPPPAWDWNQYLPSSIPHPAEVADNPMTPEKVELGRYLFYDVRLSENQTQSCASCHRQELAFTDGLPFSVGSTGEETPRSSMSLANVAYVPRLTWANPLLHNLSEQALIPLLGEEPVELGFAHASDELLSRLRENQQYQALFASAFPEAEETITMANLTDALASFQRSLVSFDSPYDRWIAGDDAAISESAQRGLMLFLGERLECFHCHGGVFFTDSFDTQHTLFNEQQYHNNGLYNLDGRGAYPEPNVGLFEFTESPSDMGKFRAPTLRNIARTAPYMHDGSIATLSEVLDHYSAGGRNITEGPYFGDGRESPNKSININGFSLTEQERADVLAFLESLTDETFLTNPAHGDPFAGP